MAKKIRFLDTFRDPFSLAEKRKKRRIIIVNGRKVYADTGLKSDRY
jgi:hypothetical protein